MRLAAGWKKAVRGQLCTVFTVPDRPPCGKQAIVIKPARGGEYNGRCLEHAIRPEPHELVSGKTH